MLCEIHSVIGWCSCCSVVLPFPRVPRVILKSSHNHSIARKHVEPRTPRQRETLFLCYDLTGLVFSFKEQRESLIYRFHSWADALVMSVLSVISGHLTEGVPPVRRECESLYLPCSVPHSEGGKMGWRVNSLLAEVLSLR